MVPIGFNAYRLQALSVWALAASNDYLQSSGAWQIFGSALALLNLLLWTYNLFGFLLLRVLPVYFDKQDTPQVEMAYTMIPIPKTKSS